MALVLGVAAVVACAYLVRAYFRGKKRLQAKAQQAIQNTVQVPAGDIRISVYVYDGTPIKKQRIGKPFRVLMLSGEKTMNSVYTGTTWTGDCCLSFNGQRIGFLGSGISHDLLARIVRKRGPVSIMVHITNYDERAGFPYVVAELPELDWFQQELRKKQ